MNYDKLKEILEKIPVSLLLVLYLGYLGFDYYSFENDDASPKVMKIKELSDIKARNAKLEAKVKGLSQFARTLDQKRAEIRHLAQELQDMKAGLPENLDVPAFMKMIVTEAKKLNLNVTSLNPTGLANQEYYSEQTFSLSFKGIFAQLVAFMDRLSNLNQIVRVDSVRLKISGPDSGRFIFLDGELDLNTFKYRGSKADTLGSALDSNDGGISDGGASNSQKKSGSDNSPKPASSGGSGT